MTPRKPIRYRDCEECGETFAYRTEQKRFCTRLCGQRAWLRSQDSGYMVDAQRRYLAADPDHVEARRQRMREYNQRPEVIARRSELFKVTYRRRAEVLKARARARHVGYVVGHTHEEWLTKIEAFDRCCAYCGRRDRKLTKDHVIPVSVGDPETVDLIDNIVPACMSCNSSKSARVLSADDLRTFRIKRTVVTAMEFGALLLDPATHDEGEALLVDLLGLELVA